MNQTVVVGMSGGVDSSVAAYLLKEQGYNVIGVTMEMLKKAPEVGEEAKDAKKICDRLEIPHYIMHFNEEFECKVMNPFVEEYLHGRTPNPCVLCNRNIKWQALME
nr:7-cyano-7-deazaguanine synthase [Lachnospiraceae bacterium]